MPSPAPADNPLQVSRPERRAVLGRHFIAVLEPLIEGGEPYADLSVERIIRAGSVSRSTFYAYFDDKGDLLRAMAEHVISELLDAGVAWWTLPGDGTKDDLREALRPAVDTYREHHAVLGAVIETATYDARVREAHVRLVNEVVASLAAHIRAHQKQGTACPDLDARRTAEWLIWMDERGLYQVVSSADDREAERLLGALTDIVWRTLYEGYREAT